MKRYANKVMWTDVKPFEVVREISEKTIEVREMKAERDASVKLDFVPGWFFAHCANQNQQKWIIESDETAPVVRIRLHKDGWWHDKYGGRYDLSDTPVKHYDYNF